ncbi:MAG: ATP synthase F1 subunit epsilon [Candidatus Pacebacteria bacterium]|nr:ATP synthase F1 subunit epsilon [Candidatus Paceibacterota bacterium]
MSDKQLTLRVISQEKKLLEEVVDKVTLPSVDGEITILPLHAALISEMKTGHLRFTQDGVEQSVVVSRGFVDVNPSGMVTVLVDSATHARDISVEKVQQAIKDAQETMSHSEDRRELLMAEASLKLAMLELKVAQKTSKSGI